MTSTSNAPITHSGIYLYLDGMVNINLSTKNVGVFEAFYNSAKVLAFRQSIIHKKTFVMCMCIVYGHKYIIIYRNV